KDRIATAEEQTEPYYAAIAARGLLLAATALTERDQVVRLDRLAACLEQPVATLTALLTALGEDRFVAERAWLGSLTSEELSGLRGMGLRLRTMVDGDGGRWLLPAQDGREI